MLFDRCFLIDSFAKVNLTVRNMITFRKTSLASLFPPTFWRVIFENFSILRMFFQRIFYRKTVLLNNFLLFFLSGKEWDVATTSAIWLLRVRYCLSVNPLDHPEGPLNYPEGPRGVFSSFRAQFLSRRLILRVRCGYYECDIAFL